MRFNMLASDLPFAVEDDDVSRTLVAARVILQDLATIRAAKAAKNVSQAAMEKTMTHTCTKPGPPSSPSRLAIACTTADYSNDACVTAAGTTFVSAAIANTTIACGVAACATTAGPTTAVTTAAGSTAALRRGLRQALLTHARSEEHLKNKNTNNEQANTNMAAGSETTSARANLRGQSNLADT